jgi:hypothetical protein
MPEKICISREDALTLLAWQKLVTMHPEKRKDIVAELLIESDKADEEIEDAHIDGAEYNHDIVGYLREGLLPVTNLYIEEDLRSLYNHDICIEGEPQVYEPCPCCNYRTLPERAGYDICPNCYWEDDGNDDPAQYSSVNHLTLQQGRDNFNALGASDPAYIDIVNRHPDKYLKA